MLERETKKTFGGVWFAMIAIPQRKTPARLIKLQGCDFNFEKRSKDVMSKRQAPPPRGEGFLASIGLDFWIGLHRGISAVVLNMAPLCKLATARRFGGLTAPSNKHVRQWLNIKRFTLVS